MERRVNSETRLGAGEHGAVIRLVSEVDGIPLGTLVGVVQEMVDAGILVWSGPENAVRPFGVRWEGEVIH